MHPVNTVIKRIQQAKQRSNDPHNEVTLVAVSKTCSIDDIITVYNTGVRHFGENRADELAQKAQALSYLPDIKWHFIGNLQTRQSLPVAQYADYFHAVDRLKIAKRLNNQLTQQHQHQHHHHRRRQLTVYLQVNISGEASKSGFECANWENDQQQQENLLNAVEQIMPLDHLQVSGLMTMAPRTTDQKTIRTLFKRLKNLSRWLNETKPKLRATELSMGMSGDFEIAIEEGATYVRVGSAIFK